VPSRAAGTAGSGEWRWLRGGAWAAWGNKKGPTGGVHMLVRKEREGNQLGQCKPKRETHFCRGAIGTRARRAGTGGCDLWGRMGRHQQSWAGQAEPHGRFK
jgi:hypothetical protein